MNQENLKDLVKQLGLNAVEITSLKLEASGREYYRLHFSDSESLVLCYLDPVSGSHEKFVMLSEFLQRSNIPSPKILTYDAAIGVTIQEDLGDTSLLDFDMSQKGNLLKLDEAISILAKLQQAMIPQLPSLDTSSLSIQMNMMKEVFLNSFLDISINFEIDRLRDEAIEKLQEQPWMNCHFDFERRNLILLEDNEIAVVDYQDLCSGPVGIDLAGLLIDHYVKYPDQQIMESLASYSSLIEIDVSPEEIFEWVRWGAIQRNMRILGILSKIYIDTDRSFRLKDLPQILNNLIELIPDKNFTALKKYLNEEVHQNLLVRLDKI